MSNSVTRLVGLLRESGSAAVIRSDKLSLPVHFDLCYNAVVLGRVGQVLGRTVPGEAESRRVDLSMAKFAHFLAMRNSVVEKFKQWTEEGRGKRMLGTQIPRGYLTSVGFDDAERLLRIMGLCRRRGTELVLSFPSDSMIGRLGPDDLAQETANLRYLKSVRLTLKEMGVR